VEEILSILHEVDLFQKQISLFLAEILFRENLGSSLFELIIGSFDFLDVHLLFLKEK